jgi:predicted nuclease of predicted toxin-antitoxin system
VKLLFDHNLSHKLPARLADVFPGSTQTRLLHFGRAKDPEIWFHARTHSFVIVSKDNDFAELAVLRGAPPKVVWLRIGNCSSRAVERLLRAHAALIEEFANDSERVVLELYDDETAG